MSDMQEWVRSRVLELANHEAPGVARRVKEATAWDVDVDVDVTSFANVAPNAAQELASTLQALGQALIIASDFAGVDAAVRSKVKVLRVAHRPGDQLAGFTLEGDAVLMRANFEQPRWGKLDKRLSVMFAEALGVTW